MRRSSPRGFTLIELLVTVAVASIVLTIVMQVVLAFQKSMQGTEIQRSSVEAGRDALFELERSLHKAGFGVDPLDAFDFAWFRCATSTVGIQNQQVCRDSVNGPDSLVFMGRNPYYRIDTFGRNGCAQSICTTGMAWNVIAVAPLASPPTVTLSAQAGQTFYTGQVLEFVCAGGGTYTMGTVAQLTPVSSASNVIVQLYPTNAAVPYFANALSSTCFGTGAVAFSIDRYGYFVQTYNGVPWLVLDTGVDLSQSGTDPYASLNTANLLPIVPYVEDFQVAYVLDATSGGTAPDSNANWVAGDDLSQNAPEAPFPGALAPAYATPDPNTLNPNPRASLNPANIRAVRVSLDLRSARPDLSMPSSWFGDPLPSMENEQWTFTNAQLGNYRRQKVMTTVTIHNMVSAGMFVN